MVRGFKYFWIGILILITVLINYVYAKLYEVKNEYIKVSVDDATGRFLLQTTGGDPANIYDDDKMLLQKNIPPTTMTTILIDEVPYIFGGPEGNFKKRAEVIGNKIITEWGVRRVNVIQEIEIIEGPSTGLMDCIRILYRIRNDNLGSVKVGVRIMLDTYLGDRDGAAFQLPGIGDVSYEAQFYRDKVPDYWYSFDSFVNPTIRSQGILNGFGATKPDKVIFACWERLYDNLWDFEVDATRELKWTGTANYDSAVALYYEPVELGAGKQMYISTLYGLFGAALFTSKDLQANISVPTTPNAPPVPVSVDVKNVGRNELDKMVMEIELPKGFTLVEGNKPTLEFVKVGTNQTAKGLWYLTCSNVSGTHTVKVKATGYVRNIAQQVIASKDFTMNYTGLVVVKPSEELKKEFEQKMKIEEAKAAKGEFTGVITPSIETQVVTGVPVYEMSKEERKIIEEIKKLDQLIDEVDKKYQILIEVYKNSYKTNLAMQTLNEDLKYFNNKLKEQESLLSNLKAEISGK